MDPAAQGHGLGGALIAFAAAEAQRRGVAALRLSTNARMTATLALSRRLGFRATRRAVADGDAPVYLGKPVAPWSSSTAAIARASSRKSPVATGRPARRYQ